MGSDTSPVPPTKRPHSIERESSGRRGRARSCRRRSGYDAIPLKSDVERRVRIEADWGCGFDGRWEVVLDIGSCVIGCSCVDGDMQSDDGIRASDTKIRTDETNRP